MRSLLAAALIASLSLAGCSGGANNGSVESMGDVSLVFGDTLTEGSLVLRGAYLRSATGWAQVLDNGTTYAFKGTGGNVTSEGNIPAGDYDRLRLLFDSLQVGGRRATLTESGIEVAVNLTVLPEKASQIELGIIWEDALFESAQGLAFTPVLSRLVVTVDGSETLRLEADEISTGTGKAPVARMRVFDPTGLEVFASTFVADSPKDPLVGNAGNITLSATASEVLQPGATMAAYAWDIGGEKLTGVTVVWPAPIDGGNATVKLTVTDSDGNADTQTLTMALRPGTASRSIGFTGTATGAGGGQSQTPPAVGGVQEHVFDVDNSTFDNASAILTHVRLVLTPGSATVPISDLDVTLDDGAGKRIGAQTGQGSQHTIDADVPNAASGPWKIRVLADPGYGVDYTVSVTLTWKGVNPGMEAFLTSYDDGHSHRH